MNAKHVQKPIRLAATLVAVLVTTACGQGTAKSSTTSALSAALAASTDSSGTLLCAPAEAQVAACTGKVAGDACVLTPSADAAAVPGTCRTTIDGAAVACAPNPPAPPKELVDACTGKSAGATCQVTEAFGNTRDGACITARDGATLVCGRVHAPPQAAVDACAARVVGDACAMSDPRGQGSRNGVCSLGPAGSGPLACAPPKDLLPNGEQSCVGLAAGATCTLGHRHEAITGTCIVPAADTAAVCVVACADLRGRFECGPGGHGGPGGPGGPGGMPGMPGGH